MQTKSVMDNLLLIVLWVVVGSGLALLTVGGWIHRRFYPLFALPVHPTPAYVPVTNHEIADSEVVFATPSKIVEPPTSDIADIDQCAEDTNASVDSLLSALMLLEDGDIERARVFLLRANQQVQAATLLLNRYTSMENSLPQTLMFGYKGGEVAGTTADVDTASDTTDDGSVPPPTV